MGSSFIITESMLEKKGRELMLEFFYSINKQYMLKTFEEIKSQRKYYDENAVKIYRNYINKNLTLRENKILETSGDLVKRSFLSDDEIKVRINYLINNKNIEIEFVFDFLSEMDKNLNLDSSLEFEINEDLFSLKKAFLNAYELFHHSGHELMD